MMLPSASSLHLVVVMTNAELAGMIEFEPGPIANALQRDFRVTEKGSEFLRKWGFDPYHPKSALAFTILWSREIGVPMVDDGVILDAADRAQVRLNHEKMLALLDMEDV